MIGALRRLGVPYRLLRYEDLVRDPRASILRVAELFDGDPPALDFIRNGQVLLGVNHTASGNPSRFRRGAVELRADVEWREQVPRWQRALVRLVTFPLRRSYGYR
jgi:hypothetical protein